MPDITDESHDRSTVGADLARQLNEILLDLRKSFGMHGRTSWAVQDVDPDVIAVRFDHWPEDSSLLYVATNVRNALLNLLHDTVPCARFEAVFVSSDRGRHHPEVHLDFDWTPGCELPSQLVVIEDNVEPQRQRWRALVDRTAGSASYFTRTRKDGAT
jgi:hypothetical protein